MAEMWDLYMRFGSSLEFIKTSQTFASGSRLPDGTFHQIVHVWIKNDIGAYLITQRGNEKSGSLCWSPPGGNVLAGETSQDAAIREAKETLGLELQPVSGTLLFRGIRFFDGCNDFVDVWLFEVPYEVINKNLSLQKEEVKAAVSVYPAGIHYLRELGLWIPWQQFDYLDRLIGSQKTINIVQKNEWQEVIDAIRFTGHSMGAAKLFDLETAFMKRAYDMTFQDFEGWPEENIDDHDIRIAEAAVDLSFSLINLERYTEAEDRINEALSLFNSVFSRGEEKTIFWRLYHAHFCKRRIMIRTGRKQEVVKEREILKLLKDGVYSVEEN